MKRHLLLIIMMAFPVTFFAQESATTLKTVYQNGAFSLFKEVADANEGNVCFSPVSVQLALSMVQNGAANNTLAQMRKLLGTSDFTEKEVNEYNSSLSKKISYRPEIDYDQLEYYDNKDDFFNAYNVAYPQCELANGVWTRQDVILLDSFVSLIKEFYDAGFGNVDFTSLEGIQVINDWVNQKTHGLIKKIYDEPQSEDLAVVLANALYFKGYWTEEFDKNETKPDSFHLGNGTAVMTDMMLTRGYFNTNLSDKFRTITLPYGESDFSMTIFLPTSGTGLPDLTADDWREGVKVKNRYTPHNVRMPKFVIDGNYDLVPLLKNLGMTDAFDQDLADFCRMRDLPMFINRVFQLSKIAVDEVGTEAAAVTVFDLEDSAAPDDFEDFKDFNVNRPFYFTIEHRKLETVLFAGRVTDVQGPRVQDLTVINEITETPVTSTLYDLSGRRLNAIPERGIYIQNGKKYIVR